MKNTLSIILILSSGFILISILGLLSQRFEEFEIISIVEKRKLNIVIITLFIISIAFITVGINNLN